MSYHQLLARLHLLALFLSIVFYHQPGERLSAVQQLCQRCVFETKTLCPACFPDPVNCDFFEEHVTLDGYELMSEILDQFNHHAVRFGFLEHNRKIVIKNLNRANAIQTLRHSICAELKIAVEDCHFRKNKQFADLLRQRILDEDLLEGAIICPPGDQVALTRFINKFRGPELTKLILMRTNIQPLLLKIFSKPQLPVPSFIFQGGFTLIESYDGEPLTNFYESSLTLRMQIADKLIDASLNFTKGVDKFRFYFTDMSPDNIVVQISDSTGVKISFVDLNNVIILDSLSKRLNSSQLSIMHSRIECDGCFAYVQNDICTHSYSDINLFAVCQLLLENLDGNKNKGFLYNTKSEPAFDQLRYLLNHCVYCQLPNCVSRQEILEKIKTVIHEILV